MADKYFSKFRRITYANTAALDITQRGAIMAGVMKNPYLFYPFDVTNGVRPDHLAGQYYSDQYMDWLVLLSNGITDPYYDWYLSPDEFEDYLRAKYSVPSSDVLKNRVQFFRNNWHSMDQITVDRFNSMAPEEIKYWEPVYNGTPYPLYYARRKNDWAVSTNVTVKYDVVDGSSFSRDDVVTIKFMDVNGSTGRAQVVTANSSAVVVQHTTGNTVPVSEGTITSNTTLSSTNATTIVTGGRLVTRNIPLSEAAYWSPVTVYDVENEINEQKKTIRVLDKSYSMQVSKELKKILK